MRMSSGTNASARAAATDFARAVARLWERELGPQLLGFYLIGSLAHGGFSSRYSDIDVLLIADEPLPGETIDRIAREAAARAPALAAKLSLFWTDRGLSVGRFPLLDRIDYLDHAVPLFERERLKLARPSLAEVRAYLAGAPFQNWSQQALQFSALAALSAGDHKRYLRAILYPARFLYSWATGAMASNDAAVAFLQGRADGLHLDLIARALACRNRGDDPLPLFPERATLAQFVEFCSGVVAAERA
jgi:predicted nucleotidyltransferase